MKCLLQCVCDRKERRGTAKLENKAVSALTSTPSPQSPLSGYFSFCFSCTFFIVWESTDFLGAVYHKPCPKNWKFFRVKFKHAVNCQTSSTQHAYNFVLYAKGADLFLLLWWIVGVCWRITSVLTKWIIRIVDGWVLYNVNDCWLKTFKYGVDDIRKMRKSLQTAVQGACVVKDCAL